MIFRNRMKAALREGRVIFGPMVSEIRSPAIAVLFARGGFDFFSIDMEHSSFTMETVSNTLIAARAAEIPAIVRPSSRTSHEYLSRPLDSGAAGLLVPLIRSRGDVEHVVKWARYYPIGERGMALSRQHTFFDSGEPAETMCQLNEEILIALQIEHREAIERLPEILSVPGIDVAFVGPGDLSASLGRPGQTKDPVVARAIHQVIEVSEKCGVIPGIQTDSVGSAQHWIHEGMKMIGFCTDIKLLLNICKSSVKELHSFVDNGQSKQQK